MSRRPFAPLLASTAFAGLAALGLPVPAAAGFERPPSVCTPAQEAALEETIASNCRQRENLTCLDVAECFTARRTKQLLGECLRSVQALNLICYGGELIYLKVEEFALQHQIDICDEIIPELCRRRCP